MPFKCNLQRYTAVYIGLGETRHVEVTGSSLQVGTWRHYAAVYARDGATFTMYVDGAQAAVATFATDRPALANINGGALHVESS